MVMDGTSRSKQYSKGGCRECKRRKIKCDEAKPACFQCKRLCKECSYPMPGEKVARVSKRPKTKVKVPYTVLEFESTKLNDLASVATSLPNATNSDLTLGKSHESAGVLFAQNKVSPSSQEKSTSSASTIREQNSLTDDEDQYSSVNNEYGQAKPTLVNSRDIKNVNIDTTRNSNNINRPSNGYTQNTYGNLVTTPNNSDIVMNHDLNNMINPLDSFAGDSFTYLQDEFNLFDQNDLDTLADDLQRFVKATMSNSMDILGAEELEDVGVNQNNENTTSAKPEPATITLNPKPLNKKPDARVPRNIPLDYIKVENRQEKFYLEEFYNDFSIIIFPLCAYDPETDSFYNPARDVLLFYATDEPVLLSAILAQGAITSFKKHKLQGDEEAYDMYLTRCLDLIDPAMKGYSSHIISNIEIVLLTVLLLTSANASSANQNWRPHLKGAKDLILRSNIAMSNANKGPKKVAHSNLLICCKFWFIAFELLASVSTKLGGTLALDEIDLLMTRGTDHEVEVMKTMGFITPEGYNLLGGYHNDAIIHYRELIKYLERCRQNQTIDYNDTLSKMRLLTQFQSLLSIEYYSTEGIVPAAGISQKVISRKLLDPIKIDGEEYLLSWLDIYHQTYTLAAMISILTKFMDVSYESGTVQSLNNQLIGSIRFLSKPSIADIKNHSYLLRSSLLLLQWPMLVASSYCFDEDDQFLLMKFFRIIGQLGSASAGMVLTRLYSVWERKSKKSIAQPHDDFDIVLY